MVYWVFLFSGKPSGEIPWFGKPEPPRTEKNVQQKTTKSTALPAVAAWVGRVVAVSGMYIYVYI